MNQKTTKPVKGRSWHVLLLTALLFVSMAFVAATFFRLIQDAKFEQEWISLATSVQVSSQQLAKTAGEAAAGNLEAFNELSTTYQRMIADMATLQAGSPASGLAPITMDVEEQMSTLSMTWERMNLSASSITERESLLLSLSDASSEFNGIIPGIQESTDRVVRQLTQSGSPNQQTTSIALGTVSSKRLPVWLRQW